MFDSLYIPGGSHVTTLMKQGGVIHWIREAFGHCKTISTTDEATKLDQTACGVDGMVFSASTTDVVDSYGVVTASGVGTRPEGITEKLKIVKGARLFLDAYAFNISQDRNFSRELDELTSMVAY